MAVDEERVLSEAYRTTTRVRRPEGQGLNDPLRPLLPHGRTPHCREDRSRHRLLHLQLLLARWTFVSPACESAILEAFDTIRIDCLNGDKYKTGKTTPDGAPDPSIFSTPEDPVGIQVGTCNYDTGAQGRRTCAGRQT